MLKTPGDASRVGSEGSAGDEIGRVEAEGRRGRGEAGGGCRGW